ncbi:phytoene/squalene synthase family protein [Halobium salinum]|uniref:Phytoene/squalene synthase family protein n=1 Tax=Halobium salinum TaxID=1364940 RepID=A0ABD5PAB1_9EURY|nr:phytoene/squalene synthase family protein [Halobium salinum]
MVSHRQLELSKSIQQRTGKTFHLATRFLPERVRHPTYVLYAFFRLADEVVDDPDGGLTPEQQRRRLDEFRAAALGRRETDDSGVGDTAPQTDDSGVGNTAPPTDDSGVGDAAPQTDDAVLRGFSEVREEYGIPDREVETFVDAMATDVSKDTYADYDELKAYMRGSAAAVGTMMTEIMGLDGEAAERAYPSAIALGEAFQLTNFLRDVGEDVVERDRVYLPRTTLSKHGVSVEQILDRRFDDGVAAAMRDEMARAESLYHEGVAGIRHLPADCRFPVLLAAVLYADHHRLIRERGYDTLTATPSLSTRRKLSLAARTRLHWARSKDPERVFARVVDTDDVDHTRTGRGSETERSRSHLSS